MEAVGVLFGQERQEQQQCSLGVWVESEEGEIQGGLARNPYLPQALPLLTSPDPPSA